MSTTATAWEIAEQGILRAVLRDATMLDVVTLCPEHFSRMSHSVIWTCCRHLRATGRPIVPDTVAMVLAKHLQDAPDELDKVTAYVGRLHGRAVDTTVETAVEYARVVGQYATLRAVAVKLDGIGRLAAAHDLRALDDVAALPALLGGLATMEDERTWGQVVTETLADLEAQQEGRTPPPVATGFSKLDRLRIFQPGELVILGARTSVGKSALALRVASRAARDTRRVLYVSMEMRDRALARRVLSGASGVPATRIKTADLSPEDWDLLTAAAGRMHTWPLFVMDRGRRDLETILGRARRMKASVGLDLVVIDYIQRVHMPTVKGRARHEAIAELSGAFKDLANDLECAVLCLAQLNRDGDSAEGRRPTLANLRESGDLEQDADTVLLLSPEMGKQAYADWRALDPRPVLLDVAKGRDGETMDIQLLFMAHKVLFGEAA